MINTVQHLPTVVKAIEPIVNRYGYIAVGGMLLLENFGIPVPGETILITAAVFAGIGKLNIIAVILIALIFSVIGDNAGFALGRYGGHPLAERYGKYIFLTKKRIDRTEAFYTRNGTIIVLIARFIDGLRQANGIIAGMTEMKWHLFLTYNIAGSALWVVVWSLLGYFGSSHIDMLIRYQLYFSILLFGGGFIYYLYKKSNVSDLGSS